ncbi:MAG: amidase family protein, partial [Nanoarchaeota archaeon]
CIICPTVPRLPHMIGEKISIEEMFQYDALTSPINLSGDCAISIPMGEVDKIPVGMQIICGKFNEQKLFQIARSFEKVNLQRVLPNSSNPTTGSRRKGE